MTKKAEKAKKPKPARTPPAPVVEDDEDERDIAETREALAPVLKKGVNAHRLASLAGAHPEDMRGFLEGRVSLTWQLRKRLRDAVPDLLAPREYGPEG